MCIRDRYNHYRYIKGKRKERTPINVAISDDGMHWKAAVVLEDSPINQYSYPSASGIEHFFFFLIILNPQLERMEILQKDMDSRKNKF